MKVNRYNKLLGDLEAEIMERIWELEKASVRQVLNLIGEKRSVAYTTVMTVMSRLYNKGILKRRVDESGAYIYSPCKRKDVFLAEASKRAVNSLIKDFGEVAVAQFFDAVESSDFKDLKKWRRKLKK